MWSIAGADLFGCLHHGSLRRVRFFNSHSLFFWQIRLKFDKHLPIYRSKDRFCYKFVWLLHIIKSHVKWRGNFMRKISRVQKRLRKGMVLTYPGEKDKDPDKQDWVKSHSSRDMLLVSSSNIYTFTGRGKRRDIQLVSLKKHNRMNLTAMISFLLRPWKIQTYWNVLESGDEGL